MATNSGLQGPEGPQNAYGGLQGPEGPQGAPVDLAALAAAGINPTNAAALQQLQAAGIGPDQAAALWGGTTDVNQSLDQTLADIQNQLNSANQSISYLKDQNTSLQSQVKQAASPAPLPNAQQLSANEIVQLGLQDAPQSLQQGLTQWVTQYLGKNPIVPTMDLASQLDNLQVQMMQSDPWKQFFSGNELALQNGYTPLTPAEYLKYMDTAKSLAQTVGLPSGYMSDAEIAQLIGNNVSAAELNERLNTAYRQAVTSDPATLQYLEQTFGITPGNGLAAYFLDPNKAVTTLEQQVTASQIAGAGINAGFEPIDITQAMKLAGMGVTQEAAVSGFKNIAPEVGLTHGLPGQPAGGPGQVTEAQLVGSQFIGDAQDVLAVNRAKQTRTAPFMAGGGFGASPRGTNVGSGTEQGVQGQQPY